MSARDLYTAMGVELDRLEVANDILRREVERLASENSEQCDTIESLRVTALRQGLSEQARMCLAMARTYFDEGDEWDSPRLRACFERAMGLVRASEEAA